MKKFGFSKKERIHQDREFERVFKEKNSFADRCLVAYVYFRSNKADEKCRLGLVVSHKLGKANQRNRIKRWLREVFRLHKHEFEPGYDILIIPRKIGEASYQIIELSMIKLLRRARVIR